MRHVWKFIGIFLFLFTIFACNNKDKKNTMVTETEKPKEKGLFVDEIVYSVFDDEAIGLKQVVDGKLDMLYTGTPSVLINGLRKTDIDKIDIYKTPSSSLALWLNPIPNKSPYTFKATNGETFFNPLAINKIRYALNFLIDRKLIVDELLLGFGTPMHTMFVSNMPGTYRYNLLIYQYGLRDTGDFEFAKDMITEAMQEASELPENEGKLYINSNGFWEYEGKPASIKFYMRADDPNTRLRIGRNIANRLEACGLLVEYLEWDASDIVNIYAGKPEDYICSMYTEAWDFNQTSMWYDLLLNHMGAPFFGNMPGGGNPNAWKYENKEIDKLGNLGVYGQYLTAKEYWAGNTLMNRLIFEDAIRIWIVNIDQLFVTNKERLTDKLVYGLGDGFNMFSVRTAKVPVGSNGKKILNIGQYSPTNVMFTSPWNPIGKDGFSDSFSSSLLAVLTDSAVENHPATAKPTSLYIEFFPDRLKTSPKIIKENGKNFMSGNVPVNPKAEKYNSATKTWEAVGEGQTCAVESVSKLVDGYYWHSGMIMSNADIRYAIAFNTEWATKDSKYDPYYYEALSKQKKTEIINDCGFFEDENGYIHSFSNCFFAADKNETARLNIRTAQAGCLGHRSLIPWEIYEACSEIIVKTSASGTKWTIDGGDANEINLLDKNCADDIKAKLEDFLKQRHIPNSLKGYITEQEAISRYTASINFIQKNEHAYISNGPGVIEKIDTDNNTITVVPYIKYPRSASEFVKNYSTAITIIKNIKLVDTVKTGREAVFEIYVSQFLFPDNKTLPTSNANVAFILQLPDGYEQTFEVTLKSDGIYEAIIPRSVTAELGAGEYIVTVLSSFEDETPSVKTTTFVIE